jgi:sporulation protein YlmC with PRC-barrel domain
MKTNRPPFAVVGLMSTVLLVGALAAWAQQSKQQNQSDQANQNQANQSEQNQANQTTPSDQNAQRNNARNEKDLSKLDDRTRGATIRASQLQGMNIQNSNGDSVGEINDLVIDSSGKVRYVAVTYGGVLGVGSKMFAVPFEAFKVRQNPDDPNDARRDQGPAGRPNRLRQ